VKKVFNNSRGLDMLKERHQQGEIVSNFYCSYFMSDKKDYLVTFDFL